ncbi:glycosyltransferase family 39 protein [Candidatus Sumerlaeota bacterium]|nr:glycosyltransferase family 39 protein [Candidatus Sumerlaeota bacterium]
MNRVEAPLAVAWAACLFGFRAWAAIGRGRAIAIGAALCLIPYWFAGFDSPYRWDAVQTAIRARWFWETGRLERFSLFYVVLSPFVSIGPSSPVAAHLFAMTLGCLTLALLAGGGIGVAGPGWGLRTALLAAGVPGFFIVYRWVVPDVLLILLWTGALVAAVRWSPRLDLKSGTWLMLLCAATAASKETGGLVLFPVAASLLLLSAREKRFTATMFALGVVAVCLVVGAASLGRYARLQGIEDYTQGLIHSDRGLTFLMRRGKLPDGLWVAIKPLLRHRLLFWATSGTVVPIAFVFFKPRTRPRRACSRSDRLGGAGGVVGPVQPVGPARRSRVPRLQRSRTGYRPGALRGVWGGSGGGRRDGRTPSAFRPCVARSAFGHRPGDIGAVVLRQDRSRRSRTNDCLVGVELSARLARGRLALGRPRSGRDGSTRTAALGSRFRTPGPRVHNDGVVSRRPERRGQTSERGSRLRRGVSPGRTESDSDRLHSLALDLRKPGRNGNGQWATQMEERRVARPKHPRVARRIVAARTAIRSDVGRLPRLRSARIETRIARTANRDHRGHRLGLLSSTALRRADAEARRCLAPRGGMKSAA